MPEQKPLVFAPQAEQDIYEIALETLLRWGPEQAELFETEILASIASLRDFPELGKPVSSARTNRRVLTLPHHRVIYDVFEFEFQVLLIEHHRRDTGDLEK